MSFHGIFSSNLMNLSAIKLFSVFPDFSLNVYRISAYGSSLIPGFGHLNLLSFILVSLARHLSTVVIFKNQLFISLMSLFSISLIHFIISSLCSL